MDGEDTVLMALMMGWMMLGTMVRVIVISFICLEFVINNRGMSNSVLPAGTEELCFLCGGSSVFV